MHTFTLSTEDATRAHTAIYQRAERLAAMAESELRRRSSDQTREANREHFDMGVKLQNEARELYRLAEVLEHRVKAPQSCAECGTSGKRHDEGCTEAGAWPYC